jgi:hypothetical protein
MSRLISHYRHCEAAERLAVAIYCLHHDLLVLLLVKIVTRNSCSGLPRLSAPQPRSNDSTEKLEELAENQYC